MTQSSAESRALLIKKHFDKAAARGTTPEEAQAFNEKAMALMLQWGIEDAMIAAADDGRDEKIIRENVLSDAPKSYSYEMTTIGVEVAMAMHCRGFFQRHRDG